MTKDRKPKNPPKPQEVNFGAAPPPPQTANLPITNINTLYDDNKLIDDIAVVNANDNNQLSENNSFNTSFNEYERKFLEYYILEKMDMTPAMKSAGYLNYTDQHLRVKGKKILIRYEEWAGDTRKVFRQCGVGDVRLALKVDKLLDDPSSKTQLGAAELTAKVLRASQDPGESGQRINITITTAPSPCTTSGLAPPSDGGPMVEVKVNQAKKPLKPLAITK